MSFLMLYVKTYSKINNINKYIIINRKDIAIAVIYAIIIGFRWTNNDLILYSEGVKEILRYGLSHETEGTHELFYQVILWFMLKVQCSVSWYFFIIAFAQIIFLLAFIKREFRKISHWIVFFFFTSLVFVESLNGMRQILATFFYMNVLYFVKEKKILYYIIGIVCATALHSSAIILLPFYFFINKRFLKDNRILLVALYLAIYVSSQFLFTLVFNTLAGYIDTISTFSDKSNYLSTEYSSMFLEYDKSNSIGLNGFFNIISTMYIIYYMPNYVKKNEMNRITFNLAYIGCCLTCITSNSLFLMRINYYFSAFSMIVLALVSHHLILEKKYINVVFLFMLYFAWFLNCVYKGAAGCAPYTLFFMF